MEKDAADSGGTGGPFRRPDWIGGNEPAKGSGEHRAEAKPGRLELPSVVPHETRNILVSLMQAALLVITLGMFTFSGAYPLPFEKTADSRGNAEPESSKQ